MKNTQKRRLINAIGECLTIRHSPLWFPDLTSQLAQATWELLRRDLGLTRQSYGTGRILARDSTAPRNVVARLSIPQRSKGQNSHPLIVEQLVGSSAGRYEDLGLTFVGGDEIVKSGILECMRDAMTTIALVPSLRDTIIQLVKVLHIVRSQSHNYDVSHSDPVVPFTVFLSVPQNCTPIGSLRVSESMVHEAMHLQLTLIERIVPLVKPNGGGYFSPWKGAVRNSARILHALYAFQTIDTYLEQLLVRSSICPAATDHVRQRRKTIAQETRQVIDFRGCPELTEFGNSLVERILPIGRH